MNKRLIIYPMLLSAGLLQARQKPNVVIIFTDDQGYQDLGCYGSPLIQTPSIDRMAKDGLKLTDFYVSASVSSASRAGLLTGRLNTKNGVKGVFFPESAGMPSEEITLAEALKEQGYITGCFEIDRLLCFGFRIKCFACRVVNRSAEYEKWSKRCIFS